MIPHLFRIRAPVSQKGRIGLTLAMALLMIGVWSGLSYTNSITPLILPKPHSVIAAFKELALEQNLLTHIGWSFLRITAGFALSVVVALPLGILMGIFPVVKHAINPFSGPLRYLPIAALIPLFIVWFGMGELMKILFLFVGIVVYLLPLIIEAVENVDEVLLETACTLKATQWQRITQVFIPAAAPLMFEAMRVMNAVGWTYIILAEIINAPYGLGRLITIAQKRSKTHWIFAGIIIILLIGYVSDRLIAKYNTKLFSWKEKSES